MNFTRAKHLETADISYTVIYNSLLYLHAHSI